MATIIGNAIGNALWRLAIALACVAALMLARHLVATAGAPGSAWAHWLRGTSGYVIACGLAFLIAAALPFRRNFVRCAKKTRPRNRPETSG